MATINVISAPNASDADAATYTIDASTVASRTDLNPNYPDSFVFSDGVVKIDGINPSVITNFTYRYHELDLDGRGGLGGKYLAIPFDDVSPAIAGQHLEVSSLNGSFYVTEGTLHQPAGATVLLGGADQPDPPATQPNQPAAPQNVSVHDNATGADLPDASSAYTGPVAGIISQYMNITPDNLNVAAKADSLFIKTGAGDDAVALHGGTNVVDCGTGSNFVTGADGFDTIFLDARNIPAASSAAGPVPGAIWDTIQSFGHGDAATLWGVGPGTALVWQKNEGAVGHTGLTLHANMPNGAEASLTLAGIDSKAGLSLSYGQSGGSNYLYVKAA